MGRSPRFCFSIKACAGTSRDDGDDSILLESKSSPEKRRWTFRKKSAVRHGPSNNVISEPLHVISENQFQVSTSDISYSEKSSSDPEKSYIVERTNFGLSEVPKELTSAATAGADYSIPEHVVIVIQNSIRSCLAKRELQKFKNVVKLQAAARGYLVRRQAAGTLRCIQAIVKMQALVRSRRSVRLMGLSNENKFDEYIPADTGKYSDMERNKTSAIRNSVSSAFARQLLESTPKTKPIHISCDPLRPDSAWNWLERWMALASTSQQNLIFKQDDLGKDMSRDLTPYDVDVQVHLIHGHATPDTGLAANSQEEPEFNGNIINDEYQSKNGARDVSDFFSNQMQQPLDATLHFELDGNPNKPDLTEDNFKNSGIEELNEAPKIDGKAVNGSRNLMNTAFAAAQSKFEVLSSAPASNRYSGRTSRDVSVSKSAYAIVNFTSNEVNVARSVHSKVDSKLKKVDLNEKLSNPNPEGRVAASDIVTEISVPSPDRQEATISEFDPKIKTLEETNLGVKSVVDGLKVQEIKTETEKDGTITVDYVEPMQVQKQSAEATISNTQIQEEGSEITNGYRNESPRSYTDFADSPMTPSSHMTLRVRTVKAENSISARNKGSQLKAKNSPTSSKSDSGARSSGDHLWKGTKNVKRPSSSGTNRAKHVGHEDDSSSSSIPNYMQLTESAKAKINTSFFQKPNNVLHLEDNYIKKRHSFPIGNEKQGSSPRIQNLTSQTPQVFKGNERRWQI